ncbi:TipJ family phage tail tip protein [Methylorubrum populi]|uniref:TipJ family phage tail tip protein n=1 Tax=Methylorubrum populi TaxID=223967 RepID=UPI000DB04A43|nr:hypothetical protein [Methylorubrum populi]PZP65888.1 MAG: phage tail protein [Methylorubrum populi]
MSSDVAVVAQPSCLDALFGRVTAVVPPGLSIDDIIARTLPQATGALRGRLRVTIGDHVVLPGLWKAVRPKAGAQVLIRAVPGDDLLRTVLNVAVTVAAIAAGQFYAPALLSALGVAATTTTTALASAAITLSVQLAGSLLVNALVPPRSDAKNKPIYAIQGMQNQLTPDGVIPLILGFVRYAPPYAATPYTQSVGDYRYIVAAFLCGYGPLAMRNWRIGSTPIERYSEALLEVRAGYGDDAPLTLYPQQMVEEPLSIELQTALLPTGGPQIRTTAADCIGCEIDTSFPGGVYSANKDGGYSPFTVIIAVRYRLSGSGDDAWVGGPTIAVTASKPKALTRTTPITFPARGRYEVELTRITVDWDEADQSNRDVRRSGRSAWSALRSIRPEYPINYDKPLALAACRIRGTGQLNGMLDTLNAEMRSICPDWDAATGTWIDRETNNPASLFRYVLTGPAIAYPLGADEVAALGDWHGFCVAKGLTYNRVHDYEASVLDVLSDIAAAGRASPHDSGTAWGVVVDRVLDTVTAHISPRNSWGFKGERPYAIFPDAFRVTFLDETFDFAKAERVVPWPGFEGEVKVTEKLDLPGITNPALVWKEARRRQYELIHRPDTYTVNQDFEALAVARGDRVLLSHDVLDRTQVAARVRTLDGGRVELDEVVTFEPGQAYACRFRRDDGSSLLRTVSGFGETRTLVLTGVGAVPEVGNLAFFGRASRESFPCTVKGVEAMENFTARLTLIDHAPQIEALVDAEVPPPWSGRAGAEAQRVIGDPQSPIILDVVSGRRAADQASGAIPYPIVVLLQAASGERQTLVGFNVRYRRSGTPAWSQASGVVAAGSVLIPGFAAADKGTEIEIQGQAVAQENRTGPWTAITGHVIAATDPNAPAPPQSITLTTPSAGVIAVRVTSSPSPASVATQIYMAEGASTPFASAQPVGDPISSGPNVVLPDVEVRGRVAGRTYRFWAVALDASSPPVPSDPAGPAGIQAV